MAKKKKLGKKKSAAKGGSKKRSTSKKKSSEKSKSSKSTKRKSNVRRGKEEVCAELRRKRKNLQNKKYRLRKKLKGLSGKKKEDAESKVSAIEKRVEKLNSKIFKCTVQYDRLKTERARTKRKMYYRRKKMRKDDLTNQEMSKLQREQKDLLMRLNMLDEAMGKDLKMEKGVIERANILDEDRIREVEPVWQAKGIIENAMLGGRFEILDVLGEKFSISTDFAGSMWALDQFIADVMSRQHKTTTPMVQIVYDYERSTIEVSTFFLNA